MAAGVRLVARAGWKYNMIGDETNAEKAVVPQENAMRKLLEIDVTCHEPVSVHGHTGDIVMIPFTGEASGPYFTGSVIGEGVDTQKISPDGECFLSARYMLEGTDADGASCRVFIENQGSEKRGFHPVIVTDSEVLSPWESLPLTATIDGREGGVIIGIYEEEP